MRFEMRRIVKVVSRGPYSVNVVKVSGMGGYRFDALDRESLPFAVDLAVLQTQRGLPYIEELLEINDEG